MENTEHEIINVEIARIRLDKDNRCIECDCVYLDTDTVIEVNHEKLPKEYNEFTRCMNDYKYINNEFVYSPIEQEQTFEEKVIDEQERQAKAIEELIILTLGGK